MSQSPKRHLERFISFCRAHPCDQQTDRQTDTQTTLCATSVATGRIYTMHAMRPNNTITYVYVTFLQRHLNFIDSMSALA